MSNKLEEFYHKNKVLGLINLLATITLFYTPNIFVVIATVSIYYAYVWKSDLNMIVKILPIMFLLIILGIMFFGSLQPI
jgi:hypothetical protein